MKLFDSQLPTPASRLTFFRLKTCYANAMVRQIHTGKWALLLLIAFCSCHTSKAPTATTTNTGNIILYYPLEKENDLDVLINATGDARVVLLGESTHGTHEYYTWRAAITKKLVEEKGFDFMAIEGDWTDAYKVNRFIRGEKKDSAAAVEVLKQFDRWPSSMWGNYEMAALVQWLNSYNQDRSEADRIGFYGLDLYSFWEWTQNTVVQDTILQNAIESVKSFFTVYRNDALRYSDSLRHKKPDGSNLARQLWNTVQNLTKGKQPADETGFMLYQQAWLILNGERYFRTLINDRVKAINLRDQHMAGTIKRLLDFYGKDSKAVIWVHNGHAGDAHYTGSASAGYTSVGEILRNDLGRDKIFCVGFGTYKGHVIAGYTWDAPVTKQVVLPAKAGSWEYLLHQLSPQNKILLSKDLRNNTALNKWIEFRSIGASYSGAAIYNLSVIPQRFDAFVFIDSTEALLPIER